MIQTFKHTDSCLYYPRNIVIIIKLEKNDCHYKASGGECGPTLYLAGRMK